MPIVSFGDPVSSSGSMDTSTYFAGDAGGDDGFWVYLTAFALWNWGVYRDDALGLVGNCVPKPGRICAC